MKIERESKDLRSFESLKKTDNQKVSIKSKGSFEQELTSQKEAESRFKLQEIMEEIDKIQDKLRRCLTVNDLMRYKKLVKIFLLEATSRAYLLNQERSQSRRGRSLLLTIKTVDNEVEALIEEFIKSKTAPVKTLETLDKIRGMLLDLMI